MEVISLIKAPYWEVEKAGSLAAQDSASFGR